VQKFVGLKDRCRPDLEALSQAANATYGYPTALVYKLAEQEKSLNHQKISASRSVCQRLA
jgi:hypothetical protein